MPEYYCEICGKGFKQKSHYNDHKNKKTKCKNNMEEVKKMLNGKLIKYFKDLEDKLDKINNRLQSMENRITDIEECRTKMDKQQNKNNKIRNVVKYKGKLNIGNPSLIKNDNKSMIVNKNNALETKNQLGQFYTTNYKYILQNMSIPKYVKHIIEPFVGNGDLLKFIPNDVNYKLDLYDIDSKYIKSITRDTLKNPPCYKNKFVLTNPPYLARNKNKDKSLYEKYDCNDLYKCFIITIIQNVCLGGIIIIPVNFISSVRKNDIKLRKEFINKYNIVKINIFEKPVFEDTTCSVCSIQFENKIKTVLDKKIECVIYPSKQKLNLSFNKENNYSIGGEIFNLSKNKNIKITRLTHKNINSDNITNIVVKCVDDSKKINLSMVDNKNRIIDHTEKCSCRNYATLIITPKIKIDVQKILVKKFNKYLNDQRIKYNSLFLPNYQCGNRKRIPFDLVYLICNHILSHENLLVL